MTTKKQDHEGYPGIGIALAERMVEQGKLPTLHAADVDTQEEAIQELQRRSLWESEPEDYAVQDKHLEEVRRAFHRRVAELRRIKRGTARLTFKREGSDQRHSLGEQRLHCGQRLLLSLADGSTLTGRYEVQHADDGGIRPVFYFTPAGCEQVGVAIPDTAEFVVLKEAR